MALIAKAGTSTNSLLKAYEVDGARFHRIESGDWAIGGDALTTDKVKALAAGRGAA